MKDNHDHEQQRWPRGPGCCDGVGRWWTGVGDTPGEIVWEADPGDLAADLDLFSTYRFEVLDTGDSRMRTVNTAPDGEAIVVPAVWALIRPRTK